MVDTERDPTWLVAVRDPEPVLGHPVPVHPDRGGRARPGGGRLRTDRPRRAVAAAVRVALQGPATAADPLALAAALHRSGDRGPVGAAGARGDPTHQLDHRPADRDGADRRRDHLDRDRPGPARPAADRRSADRPGRGGAAGRARRARRGLRGDPADPRRGHRVRDRADHHQPSARRAASRSG